MAITFGLEKLYSGYSFWPSTPC